MNTGRDPLVVNTRNRIRAAPLEKKLAVMVRTLGLGYRFSDDDVAYMFDNEHDAAVLAAPLEALRLFHYCVYRDRPLSVATISACANLGIPGFIHSAFDRGLPIWDLYNSTDMIGRCPTELPKNEHAAFVRVAVCRVATFRDVDWDFMCRDCLYEFAPRLAGSTADCDNCFGAIAEHQAVDLIPLLAQRAFTIRLSKLWLLNPEFEMLKRLLRVNSRVIKSRDNRLYVSRKARNYPHALELLEYT